MLSYLFDVLFVLLALTVAYVVSRASLVHSAITFVAVLFASLFAITNFEPIANWLERTYLLPSDHRVSVFLNSLAACALFTATLTTLLFCARTILPNAPQMPARTETIGRWVFGVTTGYLFASFLLTALLAFPAPREYWGMLAAEAHRRPGPIMASAPDYQFLAFVECTCDHTAALSSGKWLLDRPVISADANGSRWASFPIRYALWRESLQYLWR